jgi:magnesium chelatase family protein
MPILAFAREGFEGRAVTVEVDIRRGIPGVELVGLPDNAVREAKERIRAAIRNSGYAFPPDRVLVNLAPASLRKEGSSFDLPIAVAILIASGQAACFRDAPILVLGELELSGRVRPVPGVLSAVAGARADGALMAVVPAENGAEAAAIGGMAVHGVGSLAECVEALRFDLGPSSPSAETDTWDEAPMVPRLELVREFFSLSWPGSLLEAIVLAAAGGHHCLLVGPPGGGKTLAGRRLERLLPDLSDSQAIETTRIHSIAGLLKAGHGLVKRPPFRAPHHSASEEGIVGGGRRLGPGEASLAHNGILFLDEAPEFGRSVLQALREPAEEGLVRLTRASRLVQYPAAFQLILAANPCPCGKSGSGAGVCSCALKDVERYWRSIGAPLMDRIDIRAFVPGGRSVPPDQGRGGKPWPLISADAETCCAALGAARQAAWERRGIAGGVVNARIAPERMEATCPMGSDAREALEEAACRSGLSARGLQAVMRVARSAADLDSSDIIRLQHVRTALKVRAAGEETSWWIPTY